MESYDGYVSLEWFRDRRLGGHCFHQNDGRAVNTRCKSSIELHGDTPEICSRIPKRCTSDRSTLVSDRISIKQKCAGHCGTVAAL
jgi:hypothetical protein